MNLDKIIGIIRNLNEDAPTVSVSQGGVAGITGDPPVNLKKRKKPPILPEVKCLVLDRVGKKGGECDVVI